MHFSKLVLSGLIATATAIDLRMFGERDTGCWGKVYVSCPNWSPDTCCGEFGKSIRGSIGAFAIPRDWNIDVRSHSQGGCYALRESQRSNGRDTVCLGGPALSGAGYGFPRKKRETRAQGTELECRRPEVFHFEDGTEVNLEALTQEQYDEFLEFGFGGGNHADIAPHLKSALR